MALYVADKYKLTQTDRMFRYYRDNPDEAVKDILGINPVWFQRIQLRELFNKKFCMLNWGRGTSKTFTLSLYPAICAMMIPKVKIGIIAPSMRQAIYIFENLNIIKNESDFFRASISHESSSNYQYVKRLHNGAFIEAIPLGDGSTVRGRRYNIAILDEYAQIGEDINDSVIRPMLSVKLRGRENQLVISSTAYWKFNHYWKIYKDYYNKSKTEPDKYSLTEFDYRDVNNTIDSPFQIDKDQLEEAMRTTPKDIFEMEWMSIFPNEISAFFSPRLIDSCTPKFPKSQPVEVEMKAIGGKYVMGVDPMEGQSANFGIVINKCVDNLRKIVRVITIPAEKFTFPMGVKLIRYLFKIYDIELIEMDSRGGGRAIEDLLAEKYIDEEGKEQKPILNMDDPKKQFVDGHKVLRMFVFSSERVQSLYMNFKSDMQQKIIQFPVDEISDPEKEREIANREIISLKKEMLTLQQKTRGVYYAFEPARGFKKDRITAAVLANEAARTITGNADNNENKVEEKPFWDGEWF